MDNDQFAFIAPTESSPVNDQMEGYSPKEQELIRQLVQERLGKKGSIGFESLDDYVVPPKMFFSMIKKPAVSIKAVSVFSDFLPAGDTAAICAEVIPRAVQLQPAGDQFAVGAQIVNLISDGLPAGAEGAVFAEIVPAAFKGLPAGDRLSVQNILGVAALDPPAVLRPQGHNRERKNDDHDQNGHDASVELLFHGKTSGMLWIRRNTTDFSIKTAHVQEKNNVNHWKTGIFEEKS